MMHFSLFLQNIKTLIPGQELFPLDMKQWMYVDDCNIPLDAKEFTWNATSRFFLFLHLLPLISLLTLSTEPLLL